MLSGQLHASAVLTPEKNPGGKEPGYPLKLRPGRSKSRCERVGEDKNISPAGFRTPDRPARILVNIPTRLYGFRSV